MIRATAIVRIKSKASTSSLSASGVPFTFTNMLIGTLSGGESFLAALSLALGMSDMVQASAASAVRLDTMFVDEGFGSLSGNFLELAMNELIDTAENGHRLIGIISHVEEVKGRIPHRIEVTKGRTGGSAAQIR